MPQRTAPGPLRLARLALGLTQADVAARSGVSREQIVRLEAGECDPTWRTALALGDALGREPLTIFPPRNDERPADQPGARESHADRNGGHGKGYSR